MKKTILIFLILQVFNSNKSDAVELVSEIYSVSIAALLSAPDRYNQKAVRIIGAGRFEFEASEICVSMEDVKHSLMFNCLKLSLSPEVYKKSLQEHHKYYIFVEGIFEMSNAAVETTQVDKDTGLKIETGALRTPYIGVVRNVKAISKWHSQID